jgi:AAA15 family ATPase/GTPase
VVKIKKIHLENFCGYKHMTFDFMDSSGNIKDLALLYASNGAGKSTLLDAIKMVCSAKQYEGRDNSLLFRKSTYNPDYDPDLDSFKHQYLKDKRDGHTFSVETIDKEAIDEEINRYLMRIDATFDTPLGEKKVILNSQGVELNELKDLTDIIKDKKVYSYCHFIDADHLVNMNKFQIPVEAKNKFIELAKEVYGFDCELAKPVSGYYIDFIIHKYGDKVHFRRMSAGEKKIATLVRGLCDPDYDDMKLILVDNIEMHVYMERHAKMIDKILDLFSDRQFVATTHSPILVGCVPMGINAYVNEEYLYNVDLMKEMEWKYVRENKLG